MGVCIRNPSGASEIRWIKPSITNGTQSTSGTLTAGRVHLNHFEVNYPVIVDAIAFYNFATVAGNITVGIYGPIPTEETCLNAPVLVQSASTAMAGANQRQVISLTPTTLRPGRYYVAFETSDATATFGTGTSAGTIIEWIQYYDRGGGYGALTDPCPAVTNGINPRYSSTPLVRCQH